MIPGRLSGPPILLFNGYNPFLLEGERGVDVKLPKHEDDSSPSPSAEAKKE
jgi:hypothetical protein